MIRGSKPRLLPLSWLLFGASFSRPLEGCYLGGILGGDRGHGFANCSRTHTTVAMKKIGFLSFGHWANPPQSQTRSAADVLSQSIDLAVEAERLGMDGAYFRVHHFARQLASPFPLLAAV